MQLQINSLLNIHEAVVIGHFHVIHGLEVDRGIAMLGKVTSIEAHIGLRLDDRANELGYLFDALYRRFVTHSGCKHHATLIHPAEVAYATAEQIAIRNDDLFAVQAPQSGALNTDVFDAAQELTNR